MLCFSLDIFLWCICYSAQALDIDGDGKLSKSELKAAICKIAGLSTIEGQDALVDYVLDAAGDDNKDGVLTLDEINDELMN